MIFCVPLLVAGDARSMKDRFKHWPFPQAPLFEPVHRFRRDAPLWYACARQAEAQKLACPWPSHRTLLAVNPELEFRRDELRNAFHHTLTRPAAANINITVIRIPRELVAATL